MHKKSSDSGGNLHMYIFGIELILTTLRHIEKNVTLGNFKNYVHSIQ